MERFRWNFKGIPVFFKSTEESWQSDIVKAKKMLGVYEAEIETSHGTTNHNLDADHAGGDGDASTTPQPTVSKRTKKSTADKQETVQLSPVPGDVDDVSPQSDVLESPDGGELPDSTGDWFSSQRV